MKRTLGKKVHGHSAEEKEREGKKGRK